MAQVGFTNPLAVPLLVLFVCLLGAAPGPAAAVSSASPFPIASGPDAFSYEELVDLLNSPPGSGRLDARLDTLLGTPFISNEAWYAGARPRYVVNNRIGPVLRCGLWNIERGLRFEDIRLALTDPAGLRERLSPHAPTRQLLDQAVNEALALQQADVLVLNEVDAGMKRTGYRDVARELAAAAGMNYAFAVEFVEVDPVNLGLESFADFPAEVRRELAAAVEVEKASYRGLHGTAVLSRYPIRSARVVRFRHQPYDWYHGERLGKSFLERGRRRAGELVFLVKGPRQIRHGGRMALLVDLEVSEVQGGVVTVVAPHLATPAPKAAAGRWPSCSIIFRRFATRSSWPAT